MEEIEEIAVPESRVVQVVYCNVCSLPIEYCEFTPKEAECMTWLQATHPELYEKLKADPKDLLKNLKISDKAAKKKEFKVVIKRSERNRRKCVTTVFGLDHFQVELKKAAKLFANKFATGSSVAKNNQGLDEIVVQGDLQNEIAELLVVTYGIDDKLMDLTEGKR